LLANTVSALNKVKDANDLPFSKIFQMLDHEGRNFVTKDQFTTSLLGMNLGVSSEDITELFNKFKEVMEHLTSKLGGPSVLEASLQKGATQAKSKAPGTNL
jgi:hypothetical protein